MEMEKVLELCVPQSSLTEIMYAMGWTNRTKFRQKYISPLMAEGLLSMTIPDKPNSRLQKYQITPKGMRLLNRNA